MNRYIRIGFALGGGVIAFDHLIHTLPNWLAVVLYSAAVILFLVGMSISKKTSRRVSPPACTGKRYY